MKLLLLGGTRWLGSEIARAAVARGHDVTCVARGDGVPEGTRLIRADRDDDGALAAVSAAPGGWDAVVDLATEPGHVRRALRDLASSGRYLFVSSVSVYADLSKPGVTEDSPVLSPLKADAMGSWEEYGSAKVACENAVLDAFGPERSIVVRPGLIGGPGDTSGRTTYWPLRFARAADAGDGQSGLAPVLVPDTPDLPTAVIDVRDLAEWIVTLADDGLAGVFNATGHVTLLADHLAAARRVVGHTSPVVAASPDFLHEQGVGEWAGKRSLPLWVAAPEVAAMGAVVNARAVAAGLRLRPLESTLADSLRWSLDSGGEVGRPSGLTDPEEAELLHAFDGLGSVRRL